jgi:predicted enzyme related to lactoylglutathione lyase
MTSRFPDGAPCWVDLITPDRAGAERFYGGLFGWTFDAPQPELGGYLNVRLDGAAVAGLMQIPPGQPMQVAWNVHLSSHDLDATARAIVEAGGRIVLPRCDLPRDLGSMMFAVDAGGAGFGVWQPRAHHGSERVDVPGAMTWHEVYTRDPAATDRFYAAVFGHAASPARTDQGLDLACYTAGERPVAARVTMTAAFGDLPPHWLTWFAVAELDAALARARAGEGRLVHGPFATPMGRAAVVADPYGAVFAIVERPAA